jgi:environmental stress-induced protein Ves
VALRYLAAADRAPTPWKNGQGVTTEIAAFPPGADLDSFDWRVSMAEIWADGAFSDFPGVDRQLAMLEGRVDLTVDGAAALSLDPDAEPVAFPGDVPTRATLYSNGARDLNVMTRRGRIQARLRRLTLTAPLTLSAAATTLVLSRTPDILVTCQGEALRLDVDDAALISGHAGQAIRITPAAPSVIFAIDLDGVA